LRRVPIRARLTAWQAVVLAVILTAVGTFVVTRLRSDLTSELDRTVGSAAGQIALGYHREGPAEFVDTSLTVLPSPVSGESSAQILSSSGAVLHRVGGVSREPLVDERAVARALNGKRVVTSERIGGRHLRMLAIAVTSKERRQVLVVAESLGGVDRAVHRAFVLLLLGSAGALTLIAAGGWWIARKALRPVEQMTTYAERIDIADLSQRVAVPRARDELSHLALTLNSMLDRLQRGVEARESLIADTSHELRAPLAAMRSELDVSLRLDRLGDQARTVLESARDEVVRMSRIVDNLLTLARIDEGRLELLPAPLDLHEAASSVAKMHRSAAGAACVRLVLEGERLPVRGDCDRLEQVIGNLLDNAIRAAAPAGTVTLTTWRNRTEGGVAVSDTGSGVPAEARERIFERFSREDPARGPEGGAGLGLAICRDIVRAHDGRIWVEDNAPHGSTFLVALPVDADD
jgi:two-component system OmpR family sensor kinase